MIVKPKKLKIVPEVENFPHFPNKKKTLENLVIKLSLTGINMRPFRLTKVRTIRDEKFIARKLRRNLPVPNKEQKIQQSILFTTHRFRIFTHSLNIDLFLRHENI